MSNYCILFNDFFLLNKFNVLIRHTTVKMMQNLMANIDVFSVTRKSFHSRDAFIVHPTTQHHQLDPCPDQLKAEILKKNL